MTVNKEVSAMIDKIVTTHKKNCIWRFIYRVMYCWLWLRNRPFLFTWVEDEVKPVGKSIEVYHITLHDMMPHAARSVMTKKVLLEGLRANAIQELDFERLGELNGKTTIQPCWVDQ